VVIMRARRQFVPFVDRLPYRITPDSSSGTPVLTDPTDPDGNGDDDGYTGSGIAPTITWTVGGSPNDPGPDGPPLTSLN
jgi:hypothetical protein